MNYGLVTSGLYASGTSRLRHHVTSRLLTLQTSQLRFLGRLEQHGRRGQQLPLRLRRGHLLRLTRREPPLHPSRALTLATPCTHSQPAARQAAQDGARAPRRVRRVDVLRSVYTRLASRGCVVHRLCRARAQEASIASHRTPRMPELSSTGARSHLRVSICALHCLHPAPPCYLRPPLRTRST